jgi:hypothetical protein
MEAVVKDWNAEGVPFALHLGDIIDGQDTREKSIKDMEEITEVLRALRCPVHHVIGNHCVGR